VQPQPTPSSLYCLENARSPEQRAKMEHLASTGVCFMCPPFLAQHNYVEFMSGFWSMTWNAYPYEQTLTHLLLVPHKHVTRMDQLEVDAFTDLHQVLAEAIRRCNIEYYGLAARNGDCVHMGSTVAHLHIHLMVPLHNPKNPLRMRFSQ